MTNETLLAFMLFALATSITPGPNNIMLMTSGVNFGFRASLPHMLGVSFGFALLLMSTGFGLSELFTHYPEIYVVMKWLGVLYFVYYAWKLASVPIKPILASGSTLTDRAWRFRDAVSFQWINPKRLDHGGWRLQQLRPGNEQGRGHRQHGLHLLADRRPLLHPVGVFRRAPAPLP